MRHDADSSKSDIDRNPLSHRATEIYSAAGNTADCGEQFFRAAFLLHVARGPRPQRSRCEQILGVHAEDENWQARKFALDLFQQVDAASRPETQIENDEIERLVSQ